jgi:hypothetical protein
VWSTNFTSILYIYIYIYKTLVKPLLTHWSEGWSLKRKDENMLRIFERRILRIIYGQIKENGIWKSVHNRKFYKLCNERDIVKPIEIWWLRWLGHIFRIQENSCRKWLDSVEDLKAMGCRNWRRKSRDRDQWRVIVKSVKIHNGL